MQITVNGEPKDVSPDTSVLALVEQLALNPKLVVVQRNEEIVEREEYASTLLSDGDQIELVRFVGGG